jgi:Uma2 family endonuclease
MAGKKSATALALPDLSRVPRDELVKLADLCNLSPEELPQYHRLITEDNTPVDNWFAEAMYHLLVDVLYISWTPPRAYRGKFLACTNVGLFEWDREPKPAVAPDFMLSLGVEFPEDIHRKENRSYFIWRFRKPPDLALEIVSDTDGEEETRKFAHYALIKVPYYVIYDPRNYLKHGVLRVFKLHGDQYRQVRNPSWLPKIGLGLKLWEGKYDGRKATWLRWCDEQGNLLMTGKEKVEQEHQRAEVERQRAERLAAQLRAAGLEPEA